MSDMDWANISDATPSLSWPPQPSHNITNDEIERLRAELAAAIKQRDEARREACLFEVIADFNKKYPTGCMTSELARRLARIVADEKEWDCFGEKEGGGA